ncbi:MAG: hypothetical protein MI802_23700 [Desulfobacterales bacterium]|nr:hypothetical protein [Desulfobacterales bacterium]
MKILSLDEIMAHLDIKTAISEIEKGFEAYSRGEAVVPPVGHLPFDAGDCHIKYGHIAQDPYFVIKIASGFSTNRALGLPVCSGMMLVMDAKTGFPVALLQDEGMLTEIRTAIAGLIAAKYLGPDRVEKIGVIGSGGQARFQLTYLSHVTDCSEVMVWNRNPETAKAFAREMGEKGFRVTLAPDPETLAKSCNFIVTTTPSTTPLLQAEWIQKGTHITAVGADAPGKQELEGTIVEMADIRSVDSYAQCMDHGEVARACEAGLVDRKGLVELGEIIAKGANARTDQNQITLADLTGVAVQDIKISLSVYESYINRPDAAPGKN